MLLIPLHYVHALWPIKPTSIEPLIVEHILSQSTPPWNLHDLLHISYQVTLLCNVYYIMLQAESQGYTDTSDSKAIHSYQVYSYSL